MLWNFLKDQSGATAIEYGLIGSIVFLGCITAFYAFGDSAQEMYNYISSTIAEAVSRR
ncbi:Flp family type IVb pilin [Asticcacaulis tiandongensis]|uniref:Flp family type IVb pilin n=1 Tax=Asticcacaulis tiandongensis TaxID=2565365 RepID=UPI001127E5F4|nr:Flp family type IVb pilin [Asticcacaulis tiandongensis]